MDANPNRQAASDALDKARAKKTAGDHESAVRLAEKSLHLAPSDAAQAFLDFLVKFGPGSDSAKAVTRILQAGDHYAVLGVSNTDVDDEKLLKRTFQQLALKIHPDKNAAEGAQEAFQKLNDAFSTLSNPRAKQEYDAKHRPAPARGRGAAGTSAGRGAARSKQPQSWNVPPRPAHAGLSPRPAGWQPTGGPGWQPTGGPGERPRDPGGPSAGGGGGAQQCREDALRTEISQLRNQLSDARSHAKALPHARAQLKLRTDELDRARAQYEQETRRWQELQHQWHDRLTKLETQAREHAEV